MIKCIVLDDEENCRIALRELLKLSAPDFQIIYHSDDANQAHNLIMDGTLEPDLVFLDIQMPKCDGFAFLKKFETLPFQVIFTTAYDQYAIKAIRFSALDYLLKPIETTELETALDGCRKAIKNPNIENSTNQFKTRLTEGNMFEKLAIPSNSDINFINTSDIISFESSNNYTTVNIVGNVNIVSSRNIGYYEEILSGLHFFRVHNSHIINLKKIKKVTKGKTSLVEMENGNQIAISSRRKDEFIRLMNIA